MQPQATYGRGDTLAVHGVVDPMPVIRREVSDLGEPFDVERFVQVIVDMVEHPGEPGRVLGAMADVVHHSR